MNKEDKELLLKDLSARLPYKVIVRFHDINVDDYDRQLIGEDLDFIELDRRICKPYLCPMSSMTEEEEMEFINLTDIVVPFGNSHVCVLSISQIDWLNKKMFDYRGLIEKSLSLEAPEGMYK